MLQPVHKFDSLPQNKILLNLYPEMQNPSDGYIAWLFQLGAAILKYILIFYTILIDLFYLELLACILLVLMILVAIELLQGNKI